MFSVIIPLYNKEKYIAETLQAVLSQTFIDFEVIVVDDSSTDGSLQIVRQFSDARLRIFTKPNGGVSAARNYGIKQATHEIIAFLDADDVWADTYLEHMAELIRRFPSVGLFASSYSFMHNGIICNKNLSGRPLFSELEDYFEMSFKCGFSLNITSATCLRRELALQMPMFREGIQRGEDIDVWLRICLTHHMAYYNEPLMFYRSNTSNSLSANYTDSKEDFPYLEWLDHKCASRFYRKYVVVAVYLFAKSAYYAHDYQACLYILSRIWHVEPKVKGLKRIYLMVNSWFHMFNEKTRK